MTICKSTKQALKHINQYYTSTSSSIKSELEKEWFNLFISPDGSNFEDYIRKISIIAAQRRCCGSPVTEIDEIVKILEELPQRIEHIRHPILSKIERGELISKAEVIRTIRREIALSNRNNSTILFNKRLEYNNTNSNNRKAPYGRRPCTTCRKDNHKPEDCWFGAAKHKRPFQYKGNNNYNNNNNNSNSITNNNKTNNNNDDSVDKTIFSFIRQEKN